MDLKRAEHFGAKVPEAEPNAKVRITSQSSLLKTSDLILFATVAAHPHVHDPQFVAHAPVVLHISLRDLAPEFLVNAYNIVDDVDHVMRADTSLHLTEQLTGTRDFVAGRHAR